MPGSWPDAGRGSQVLLVLASMSDRQKRPSSRLGRWMLEQRVEGVEGPQVQEGKDQHTWWQVVCLTGVDYFSTLGYIPGIAIVAAGALSPMATLLIVLLTLLGMLPMYSRVAEASPRGQGSIVMLENLLSFWKGKVLVLILLGFVATAWLVTITLSAADATAHIVENPLAPEFLHGKEVIITLILLAALGAVFLRGFGEAIWLAVLLVVAYLLLNLVVVGVGFSYIATHPETIGEWQGRVSASAGNPLAAIGIALLIFPRLALGLSGFETGVGMMPLVRGDEGDDPAKPAGRIRNTRKMLLTAALIMSFFLLTTSLTTTLLISPSEFGPDGSASDRAMSFVAHEYLGDLFGTVYDVSTISILWFAGASAMAGLLNIVPRYLPRYGMAPDWTRALRPLVLVYISVAIVITILFDASVDAQSGAYATGVLAMMTSAAFAVTLTTWREGSKKAAMAFGVVLAVFVYALVANEVQRPDGLVIATFFVGAIVLTSLISRVRRSTELRTERIEVDDTAQHFIDEAAERGEIHLVAHRRRTGSEEEYARKEKEQREDNHIPAGDAILFLEVEVEDASEFADVLEVEGVEIGRYEVLRLKSSTVPNAIAALLLHLQETTGRKSHCYFGWTEGNPIVYLIRYLLFGEGDTAPVTREVLREAQKDPERRPAIHVGG